MVEQHGVVEQEGNSIEQREDPLEMEWSHGGLERLRASWVHYHGWW